LYYDVSKKESQDLKDEYKLLAEKMFGIIKVGAIDCHEEEELCEEFGVYETPKIKIFTENAHDDGLDYAGKKEWKAISASAASKMQSFVSVVTDENYEKFIETDPHKNKVLIFTEKKNTAPLIKALSKTYKEKLSFGQVKRDPELFKKFGVTTFPTLMVLSDPTAYKGEVYEMTEMKIDQLKKFLSTYAFQQPKKEKTQELTKLVSKGNNGVCGKKSSNLCLILFLKGKGEALFE